MARVASIQWCYFVLTCQVCLLLARRHRGVLLFFTVEAKHIYQILAELSQARVTSPVGTLHLAIRVKALVGFRLLFLYLLMGGSCLLQNVRLRKHFERLSFLTKLGRSLRADGGH